MALVFGALSMCALGSSSALGASIELQGSRVSYVAASGESNAVTVDETAGAYAFTDAVPIVDGDGAGGCSASGTTATCPKSGVDSVSVDAMDLADSITIDVALPGGTILDGGAGDDTISGGPGHDLIRGGEGADLLDGAGGDDTVDTGPGDPFAEAFEDAHGGGGVDVLTYASRVDPVTVDLRGGYAVDPLDNGIAEAVGGFAKVVGGSGNDFMVGGVLNDTLVGGLGADVLCGGLGNDTVDYSDSPGPVHVSLDGSLPTDPRLALDIIDPEHRDQYAKARTDCRTTNESSLIPGAAYPYPDFTDTTLHPVDCVANDGMAGEGDCVGEDVENITGSDFADTLVGNDTDPLEGQGPRVEPHGINVLAGGDGNDTLDGRGGADVLEGGDGSDTVTYADRSEPVSASIDGAAKDGGALDSDSRSGLTDSIGQDVENIVGGSGDDTIIGDGNVNRLEGGPGNDLMQGGGGGDSLEGGDGADTLLGLDGNDDLRGGGADDRLDGGDGADVIDGGEGTDALDYSTATTSVSATPDGIANDGRVGEGDDMLGTVESIDGGSDSDVLVGNDGAGVLNGGPGDDTLDGGGGSDTLLGGSGFDGASYAARSAPVSVDLAQPGGDGQAGENDNVAADVEEVTGGAGTDTLSGGDGTNLFVGGAGDDTLAGRGGDDQVFGGPGNDKLSGGAGGDSLNGDEGNDQIQGGDGGDSLEGGPGTDQLEGSSGPDVLAGGDGIDTVDYSDRKKAVDVTIDGTDNDGEANEHDQIRLSVESAKTGAGDDTIDIRDGIEGDASCGKGSDLVTTDTVDRVSGDCEEVDVEESGRCSVRTSSMTVTGAGRARLHVHCPIAARGTVTLETNGYYGTAKGRARTKLTLGRKSFSLEAGRSAKVDVKLNSTGRRLVRRNRRLRSRATIALKGDPVARASKTRKTITIKAPGRSR